MTYEKLTSPRYGDWMQTYTGRQFWPLDPRPEEVDILDIAHALSMQCRYAGHCEHFYSVAEHSVLCSTVVPPELALEALLHDATEAYLQDIIRPVKPWLIGYAEAEQRLAATIGEAFDLNLTHLHPLVKEADNAVLLAEAEQIMKPHPAPWSVPGEPAVVKVRCLDTHAAKTAFLNRYKELTNG